MNSAHCLLWLTIAFLWIFLPVLYGHPQQLPEIIEDTNEDSSTCYGTLKQFQPSCSHLPGTVIGVQAVKVGAKQTSLDCPENVPDAEARNDTCCTPNATTDCIQVFDYMKSFIPEKYKFHNLCSGYSQCIKSAETVWAQTDCDNSTVEYMKNTNYMFMEFSCIEETKIRNMCSDQNYTGSTIYLQSPEYPDKNISANINKCTCHVTSTSDITMYTLDVRLYGQTLTVTDRNGSQIYNESSSTMFNITSTVLTGGDVWLTLNTSSNGNGAYVWVGFEAMNLSSLAISCKVYGLKETETDVSSPVTPSNSTTTLKSNSSTDRTISSSTTTKKSPTVPIIIGSAVGALLLLLFVLLVCYLVKRKKRNLDRNRKISTLMQDDKESEISRNTRRSFDHACTPMNENFKSSSIYSNKVEPTRYIEEHGNIKSNYVLPSISRSSRRLSPDLGNGFVYQPSRLPPISNGHADAFRSVNESSSSEPQHRKKSKKQRSHKHKHRHGSQSEDVKEARFHGTEANVHNEKRYTDHNERRYSDNKERRHSENNERRHSDNKERRHSDNNESRHIENNERRQSKERRNRRHSSKISSNDN